MKSKDIIKRTPFHDTLKKLRKNKMLTQEELSWRLKIKRSAIGAYEEGRAEPPLNVLIKMALEFEVTIDSLVNGTEIKIIEHINDPEIKKRISLAKHIIEDLERRLK